LGVFVSDGSGAKQAYSHHPASNAVTCK
jgi:hypothetical protein